MVYAALEDWYEARSDEVGRETSQGQLASLDFFNQEVQRHIFSLLMPQGTFSLPYSYALVISLPTIWNFMDKVTYVEHMPWLDWARCALHITTQVFCVRPSQASLLLLCCRTWRPPDGQTASCFRRVLGHIVSAICSFLSFFLLWALTYETSAKVKSPLPQLVSSVLIAIFTFLQFGGWRSVRHGL